MRKLDDVIINEKINSSIAGGKLELYWNSYKGEKKRDNHVLKQYTGQKQRFDDSKQSTQTILKKYKLKCFEFGNWLNQNDREAYCIACNFALENLSKVVGTTNLGFDNNIGIAFGARGFAGAVAHYEPVSNVINLTKEKGHTSLAHEWAHALDYCLGAYCDQNIKYCALSGGGSNAKTLPQNKGGKLRALVNKIVDEIIKTENFKKILKNGHKVDYYSRRTEIFARFFEQYCSQKLYADNYKYLCKEKTHYYRYITYISEKDIKKFVKMGDQLMKEVKKITK